MIVWSSVETSCPVCAHRLRVREVGSGFVVGQDTDLLIRMGQKHVIEAEIQTCPGCLFSAYAREFISHHVDDEMVERFHAEFADLLLAGPLGTLPLKKLPLNTLPLKAPPRKTPDVSEEDEQESGEPGTLKRGRGQKTARQIRTERTPGANPPGKKIRRKKSARETPADAVPESRAARGELERGESDASEATVPVHLQYWYAGMLAPLLGLPPRETGARMLRAYWCLRLDRTRPRRDPLFDQRQLARLRTLYLRQAIAYLRKALRHEKEPVLVYLVAELCRRNSNFVRSQNYFQRFLDNGTGPEYLRDAAVRLVLLARREDSGHRRLEEILYETSEDDAPEESPGPSEGGKSSPSAKPSQSAKSRGRGKQRGSRSDAKRARGQRNEDSKRSAEDSDKGPRKPAPRKKTSRKPLDGE